MCDRAKELVWYIHIQRHLRNPFIFLPKPVQLQVQLDSLLIIIYCANICILFKKLRAKIKTRTEDEICGSYSNE
jgi:hypothetical protein